MYTSFGGDECSCPKFHHTADLPLEAALIRAQAHLTPDGAGLLIKTAHGNMDGVTVFHCPFCGSGQVVNSGTAIECGFCETNFSVIVQPQFSMMPQTVNGEPYTPGTQPNPGTTPAPNQPPPGDDSKDDDEDDDGKSFGGDDLSEKIDTSDKDSDSGNPFAKKDDSGDDDDKNPFAKSSFVTASGVALPFDKYLDHLALAYSPDREQTLAEMQRRHARGA